MGNLLLETEQSNTNPRDVDTQHLQVEPLTGADAGRAVFGGARGGTGADTPANYPAADHIELDTGLSVAELGQLLESSAPPSLPPVNVDHLSLANPFEEKVEAIDVHSAPAAEIASDFSVAEAGTDLLQEHEKRKYNDADIDLSKLSLSED